MGGARIGANLRAPFSVDRQMHAVADPDRSRLDRGAMCVDPPERLGRIADRRLQSIVAGDGSGVAHLAAAFTIERRLVDDDVDHIASAGEVGRPWWRERVGRYV